MVLQLRLEQDERLSRPVGPAMAAEGEERRRGWVVLGDALARRPRDHGIGEAYLLGIDG